MKRFFALLLAAVMLLMSACADNPAGEAGENPSVDSEYDFGVPTDSAQDLASLDYLDVIEVDGEYQLGSDGEYSMISVLAPEFEIGGCAHPSENSGRYYRLDYANKGAYSQENASRAANTTGITVRFCTTAPKIKIEVEVYNVPSSISAHMNGRGVYGIDVYVGTGTNRQYCGVSQQLMADTSLISVELTLPGGYQEVMINLPLYVGARNIKVGFPKGTALAAPTKRDYGDIVIYGSSITQGASASRPGLAYTNILGRTLNANIRNLGFSASAMGEQVIAEYIASLENISAVVMDYDHNNTLAGLQQTHYAFYKTIRDAHPDIPIIFMSRPVYFSQPTQAQQDRINVILDTYNKAVAAGDKNVYFVNGADFFPDDYPDLYMVDTTHPNDLGMYYMAKAVYPVLKAALDAKDS